MEKLKISKVAGELKIGAKAVYYLIAQGYLKTERDPFSNLAYVTRAELNRFKRERPRRGAKVGNQHARKYFAESENNT